MTTIHASSSESNGCKCEIFAEHTKEKCCDCHEETLTTPGKNEKCIPCYDDDERTENTSSVHRVFVSHKHNATDDDEFMPSFAAYVLQSQLPLFDITTNSPVKEFVSKCNQWLISLVSSDFVIDDNNWKSSVTCYLHKVNKVCKNSFKRQQQGNKFNEIACAFHTVNALSIKQFESLAESREMFAPNNQKVILYCCFLLTNSGVCQSLSMRQQDDHWYDTKLDILLNFLQQQAQDLTHSAPAWKFQLLFDCANVLHDLNLTKQIQKRFNTLSEIKSTKCGENVIKAFSNFALMIEADGNVYDRARDPPGQRSIYIPPGDVCSESYRLSTFIKYPQEVPANPRFLASAGFYYTGYKDRVKCFSCALCIEDWVYGDDVRSAKWHRQDCALVTGKESGNVPIGGSFSRFMAPPAAASSIRNNQSPINRPPALGIDAHPQSVARQPAGEALLKHSPHRSSYTPMQTASPVPSTARTQFQVVEFATIPSSYHENFLRSLDLRKESERSRSFEHWPCERPTVQSADLARSGFFYLGNLDRVQCFSCGGVLRNWNYGDNVQAEHRRHFPHCRMVQGSEQQNVCLTPEQRATVPSSQHVFHEPPDPSEDVARDLRNMFQCNFAVNPHMRNEDTRLETYDHRWPTSQVNATPRQIAAAGFFYLGERDRVKCWYCNGGLQNWDPQDEPWTEHAKWFPTCEFLLQRKGPDFVHRMVAMFPNLNRPVLRSPHDVPPARERPQIGYGSSSRRGGSPPPAIYDPQVELKKQSEQFKKAMESETVRSVKDMGFDLKTIKSVVKRRIRESKPCTRAEELVDDIGNYQRTSDSDDDDENEMETDPPQPASTNPKRTGDIACNSMTPMDAEDQSPSMQARIKELQDERLCKICLDQPSDIVFVPCGHLCSCGNCATSVKKCPMCRMKIQKSIRTYMS
uniref:ZF(RING)-14 zinc finger protein n=1 Tax=Phallusia mammillata TaxID=59560 RepID=A0A6F9D713_9ASCI|nr:ZF(RING)-14 zinc finger protein [Phallusia mammillata]